MLVPFPYTDLSGNKKRPALIISNKELNTTEDRICCLITSNKPKDALLLDSFQSGKLPFKSWVKPHRIFTINARIIHKKLCTVSNKAHAAVLEHLQRYIELN